MKCLSLLPLPLNQEPFELQTWHCPTGQLVYALSEVTAIVRAVSPAPWPIRIVGGNLGYLPPPFPSLPHSQGSQEERLKVRLPHMGGEKAQERWL